MLTIPPRPDVGSATIIRVLHRLSKYEFKDKHGHPLENCQEYIHTAGAVLELHAALTWLLDDISDAEEDINPETGEEYDSCAFAKKTLETVRSKIPELYPARGNQSED